MSEQMNYNDISVFSEVSITLSREQWHQVGTLGNLDWVICFMLRLPLAETNANIIRIVISVKSNVKAL